MKQLSTLTCRPGSLNPRSVLPLASPIAGSDLGRLAITVGGIPIPTYAMPVKYTKQNAISVVWVGGWNAERLGGEVGVALLDEPQQKSADPSDLDLDAISSGLKLFLDGPDGPKSQDLITGPEKWRVMAPGIGVRFEEGNLGQYGGYFSRAIRWAPGIFEVAFCVNDYDVGSADPDIELNKACLLMPDEWGAKYPVPYSGTRTEDQDGFAAVVFTDENARLPQGHEFERHMFVHAPGLDAEAEELSTFAGLGKAPPTSANSFYQLPGFWNTLALMPDMEGVFWPSVVDDLDTYFGCFIDNRPLPGTSGASACWLWATDRRYGGETGGDRIEHYFNVKLFDAGNGDAMRLALAYAYSESGRPTLIPYDGGAPLWLGPYKSPSGRIRDLDADLYARLEKGYTGINFGFTDGYSDKDRAPGFRGNYLPFGLGAVEVRDPSEAYRGSDVEKHMAYDTQHLPRAAALDHARAMLDGDPIAINRIRARACAIRLGMFEGTSQPGNTYVDVLGGMYARAQQANGQGTGWDRDYGWAGDCMATAVQMTPPARAKEWAKWQIRYQLTRELASSPQGFSGFKYYDKGVRECNSDRDPENYHGNRAVVNPSYDLIQAVACMGMDARREDLLRSLGALEWAMHKTEPFAPWCRISLNEGRDEGQLGKGWYESTDDIPPHGKNWTLKGQWTEADVEETGKRGAPMSAIAEASEHMGPGDFYHDFPDGRRIAHLLEDYYVGGILGAALWYGFLRDDSEVLEVASNLTAKIGGSTVSSVEGWARRHVGMRAGVLSAVQQFGDQFLSVEVA